MVDHNLTGQGNATLEVNLKTNMAESALAGQELLVVSNATALVGAFGAVEWNTSWQGKVVYNHPTGTVKLTRPDPGSMFRFR